MGSPPRREWTLARLQGCRPGGRSGLDGWGALPHGFTAVVWTPPSVLAGAVSVAAPPVVVGCASSRRGRLSNIVSSRGSSVPSHNHIHIEYGVIVGA